MTVFTQPVDQDNTVKLLEQLLELAKRRALFVRGWQLSVDFDRRIGIIIDAETTFDHMEDLRRAEEDFRRGPQRETRLHRQPDYKVLPHEGGTK